MTSARWIARRLYELRKGGDKSQFLSARWEREPSGLTLFEFSTDNFKSGTEAMSRADVGDVFDELMELL